jgi:hypothetical protein
MGLSTTGRISADCFNQAFFQAPATKLKTITPIPTITNKLRITPTVTVIVRHEPNTLRPVSDMEYLQIDCKPVIHLEQ